MPSPTKYLRTQQSTRLLRFGLGLALSSLALWFILSNVRLSAVIDSLKGANYSLLVFLFVPYFVAIWGKVVRWQLLLSPSGIVSRSKLFSAMMIGYMANTILPARLGELVRAYFISESASIAKVFTISSIGIEKILDTGTLLLLLLLVMPFVNLPVWITQSALYIGVVLLVLIIVIVIVVARSHKFSKSILTTIQKLPFVGNSKIVCQVDSIRHAFQAVNNGHSSARLFIWSILIWFVSAVTVYITMIAFHLDVPFSASILILCVTGLGMIVPSAPAYIGSFHYLTITSLAIFGVETEIALAFAIVFHLTSFLPVTLAGLVYVWKENVSHAHIQPVGASVETNKI